jgi:hypothetical protein
MGFSLSDLMKFQGLKDLLTKENLIFLERLLMGLTDPTTPGYSEFWTWFKTGLRDPEAYGKAYRALTQLVRELKRVSQ